MKYVLDAQENFRLRFVAEIRYRKRPLAEEGKMEKILSGAIKTT